MYVLGISGGFRAGNMDGAACLIHNNTIIAAAEEERFIRVKHAAGLIPLQAIHYCLREACIDIKNIDALVFAGATYTDIKDKLERYFTFKFGYCPKIYLIEHHLAHAASAFFVSGFDEANILTMDLSGDGIATLMSYGCQGKITKIKQFTRPNSLGAFYNIITQYLGFNRNNDEYKVMGLASYGKPVFDLTWLLKKTSDGYLFNQEAMVEVKQGDSFPSMQEPVYSRKFLKKFTKPRLPGSPITSYHMNFAASGQRLLENVICNLVREIHHKSGSRNICIAGGVGLNCVANAKVRKLPFIDNVFISPAASDAGLAMGCALQYATEKGFTFDKLTHAYWGPGYSNKEIENTLNHIKCNYSRCADIPKAIAKKLIEGRIIGWFQGRMEYGPRALGARSILGDPRRKNMKDRINHVVKFRESFRPFAPSVLAEKAADYFENAAEAPFMTLNFDVIKKCQKQIPAVVHVDGTSRVQTVAEKDNPTYYHLIKEFYKLTGIPIVLNTSFNVREEPIVCTPFQAVATFYESGLDCLAIGDFILEKGSRPHG